MVDSMEEEMDRNVLNVRLVSYRKLVSFTLFIERFHFGVALGQTILMIFFKNLNLKNIQLPW